MPRFLIAPYIYSAVSAALFMLFAPGSLRAQQGLESLYGSKNIQAAAARYMPIMLPDTGAGGEFVFSFNTLSSRSEYGDGPELFYGVALGGGGVSWQDSQIGDLDKRDAGAGYALLQFEGKMFLETEDALRPYLGCTMGVGFGSYWIQQVDKQPEVPAGSLTSYNAGVEAGVHIRAGYKYFLTVAAGGDFKFFPMGSKIMYSYPAFISVGISRWRGRMP